MIVIAVATSLAQPQLNNYSGMLDESYTAVFTC